MPLVEEIVGDIRDKHEPPGLPNLQKLDTGEVLLRGNAPMRGVNEVFSLSLPDEEADTVGALVFGRLGHVAGVGDELLVEGGAFALRVPSMKFSPRKPGLQVHHGASGTGGRGSRVRS